MKYFYAQIGKGNKLAKEYLRGESALKTPAIPIFFDCEFGNRQEFLDKGGAKEQGRNYFWCSDNHANAIIVVINNGKLFLVRPEGEVVFWKCNQGSDSSKKSEYIKLLPISIILEKSLLQVPAIVSDMRTNAYFYSGAFREIRDLGNIRAIQTVLNVPERKFNFDHSEELLFCLSSMELQTLIAKIFEEAGCFVPAYGSGAIEGIDIIAKNMKSVDIVVGEYCIPANSSISFQVKRTTNLTSPTSGCDYLISINNNAKELLDVVRDTETTKQWLENSLSWVSNGVLLEYLSSKKIGKRGYSQTIPRLRSG